MSIGHGRQLVVFADDWGRHPSSAQHLIRHLPSATRVIWVNTIGSRPVRLSRSDLSRGWGKLRRWLSSKPADARQPGRGQSAGLTEQVSGAANLTLHVLNPPMWPRFRYGWQRQLNTHLIHHQVSQALAGADPACKRVAVTTLPLMAPLVDVLEVDRWVYYCVDDFVAWPGLDGPVMQQMQRQLVGEVDAVIAVSDYLADHLRGLGCRPWVLTHGIDLAHWQSAMQARGGSSPAGSGQEVVFWGLIDRRLDVQWCQRLADHLHQRGDRLVLAGPSDSPDPRLADLSTITRTGAVPYEQLPQLAARAAVLVMPYAELPATRAMQPLKFKEYLATGKPVVARRLPAVELWADAADLVNTADDLLQAVTHRLTHGIDPAQQAARLRLQNETWAHKARTFDDILFPKAEELPHEAANATIARHGA